MKVLCIGSILTLVLLPCGCGTRDPSKAATSKQESGEPRRGETDADGVPIPGAERAPVLSCRVRVPERLEFRDLCLREDVQLHGTPIQGGDRPSAFVLGPEAVVGVAPEGR